MPVDTCVGGGVCHRGGVGMPVDTCVCLSSCMSSYVHPEVSTGITR